MSRQRSIEVIEAADFVTIGELVRITGLRYSTLKYYSEENILDYEQNENKLIRRYNREKTLNKIAIIKSLKEAGFSIYEIKKQIHSTN